VVVKYSPVQWALIATVVTVSYFGCVFLWVCCWFRLFLQAGRDHLCCCHGSGLWVVLAWSAVLSPSTLPVNAVICLKFVVLLQQAKGSSSRYQC
jgi:hypothetical protein